MSVLNNTPMVDIWSQISEKFAAGDVKLPTSETTTSSETPNWLPPCSGSIDLADAFKPDFTKIQIRPRQMGKSLVQEMQGYTFDRNSVTAAAMAKQIDDDLLDSMRRAMNSMNEDRIQHEKTRRWIRDMPRTQQELDDLTLAEAMALVRSIPLDGLRKLTKQF